MFCYKSTHLNAKNATVLYDDNYAQGSLWFRDSTANPLRPCSAPWTQDLQCTVCHHDDQVVYAMCRNLTDKVRMVMEAVGNSVNIFKSDCPTPPAPPEDTQQWPLPVMIAFIVMIILIFIFIIIFFIYKRWKRSRVEQTRNEIQSNSQEVTEMTLVTAEANEENQTPPLLSCCVDGINNGSQQQLGVQQV